MRPVLDVPRAVLIYNPHRFGHSTLTQRARCPHACTEPRPPGPQAELTPLARILYQSTFCRVAPETGEGIGFIVSVQV